MKRFLILGAVFLATAAPLSAQTFTARNGVTVVPVAAGFSVRGDAGIGARGMWCAAADYAQQIKGARAGQRIYVVEARKRGIGQRGAVTFSLQPPDRASGAVGIVGLSILTVGANLGVGHAIGFCFDHKLLRSGGGR